MAVLLYLMQLMKKGFIHDERLVAVIMLCLVITMGLCAIMVRIINVYAAPLALGSLLLVVLFDWQTAIPATVAMSIMVSGLAAGASTTTLIEMLSLVLMNLAGSVFAIRFLQRGTQRVYLLILSDS